jgi:hypothetical protein
LARANEAWLRLSSPRRALAASMLLAVATLPVLSRQYIGGTSGDIKIYFRAADAVFRGAHVYRDVQFEYPIYALLWCLPPRAFSHDVESYRFAFGIEMWAFDAAIKAALLWLGLRARRGLSDLVPFLLYSIGSAAGGHVLLQRYDPVPAALSVAAVLATAAGWPLASGALVAVGAGTKLYPALLFPVLAALEWHRGRAHLQRFVVGAALATIPALIAAAWLPWWQFASVHVSRGLQVESLAASIIWALHFIGVPAAWENIKAVNSNEVTGPVAAAIAGPARLLWVMASLGAVGAAARAAWHLGSRSRATGVAVPLSYVAAVALLPIAAFVSTNIVLSPQFMLWLVPLAALVFFDTSSPAVGGAWPPLPRAAVRAGLCIVAAALMVPVFFPHREYGPGLGGFRTGVLVLRNLVLLYATWCLWSAARTMRR